MTIRLILLILITNFVFAKDSIETWGYLMKGEESYFPKRSSITDVAYFEMKIDINGDLKGNLVAHIDLLTSNINLKVFKLLF